MATKNEQSVFEKHAEVLEMSKAEFKEIQDSLALSNRQLAERLGVSPRAIEEYRRENTAFPDKYPPRPVPPIVALAMRFLGGDPKVTSMPGVNVRLGGRVTLPLKSLVDFAEKLADEKGYNLKNAIFAAADELAAKEVPK